jgi:hypothetical protein
MALPAAHEIIRRAEKREKITRKDRMHAIGYLMATDSKTDTELAEMFNVSPRQIRFDKQDIKKEKVDILKEENVALVIVDLQMNIERQIRDLERSKASCKVGTDLYRKHCDSIIKTQLALNATLRELGWLPKNIGNMTITSFKYEAIVDKDTGGVDTRRVDMFDDVVNADMLKQEGQLQAESSRLLEAPRIIDAAQIEAIGTQPQSTGNAE